MNVWVLVELNDTKFYRQLDIDQTSDIQTRIQFYIKRLHKDNIIDDKTKRFLIQTDPKPGRFYILPKIHKQGNPGRPIVSSNGHPTERISQFVDYRLKPLVHKTASFIKDTTHFLNKLDQLGQLPSNAILVTLDVSSLYTNWHSTQRGNWRLSALLKYPRPLFVLHTHRNPLRPHQNDSHHEHFRIQQQLLHPETRHSHGNTHGSIAR